MTATNLGWLRHGIPSLPMLTVFAAYGLCHFSPGRTKILGIDFGLPTWLDREKVTRACVAISAIAILIASQVSLLAIKYHDEEAAWLRVNAKDARILCDEPAVIVRSRLPLNHFVRSYTLPNNRELAIEYMRAHNIAYIVWSNVEYSILIDLFPELEDGKNHGAFVIVFDPPSNAFVKEYSQRFSYIYWLNYTEGALRSFWNRW